MIFGRVRDALLGAMMLSTCNAGASPSPVVTPAAVPPPTELRPEAFRLVETSPVGRAAVAFEAGRHAEALELVRSLPAEASAADRARMSYIGGRASAALGNARDALGFFDAVPTDHPLARFAALHAAELDAPERALVRVRGLLDGWGGAQKARRIEARALLATNHADAETVARAVLAADDLALWSVAIPLAERLVARGATEDAIAVYRRVATRIPRATLARSAEAQIATLLATLPEDRRAALAEPSTEDVISHAAALSVSSRVEGIAAYDALLARLAEDAPERCTVLEARGRLVAAGRDRARTAEVLTALAETCAADDVRAYALFKAGRALHQSDRDAEALVLYERLARDIPLHRLADDAVIYAAALDRDAGRLESLRARLASVPVRHPEGDMRNEALFLLGFEAYGRGMFAEALTHFDAARAIPETAEDVLGRAAYWYARTLTELARLDEAALAYEGVVNGYPLSFYAQQALARLEASSPARAAAMRAAMPTDAGEPLVFDATDGLDLGAATAIGELMIVGALDEAARELSAMGAFDDDAPSAELWLAASLYEATGHANEAVRLLRRRLETYRTAAPVGTLRTMWRIAYPRAFAPLIEDAAARESVPSALVRAIAREESSFDPTAVSHAAAYGLIQILVPTARGYRQALGMNPTADTLRDPEVNLRFGTRFMSFLSRRYGTEMLVPPAYNAGHGSLDRWMRRDPTCAFDVFVEEIPYEETRRYTRRVLQTYGIYAWLDEGRLPTMPLAIGPRPSEAPAVAKP